MMGIGPILMGTVAAAGSAGGGFLTTPVPMYVDGAWWSFTRANPDTGLGIRSEKSTDNGATWVFDTEVTSGAFLVGLDHYANGILGNAGGAFINHKDLSGGNDWVATNVSTITGGYLSGGTNLLHEDHDNLRFILNKGTGDDLYTSTDLVTYTPVNGVVKNNLTLLNHLSAAHWIVYVGGQYVAYGIKVAGGLEPDIYGVATSPDLLTWTSVVATVPVFYQIVYFNGAYLAYTNTGGSITTNAFEVWRSVDFITWVKLTLPVETKGVGPTQFGKVASKFFITSAAHLMESTDGITFTATDKAFFYSALGGQTDLDKSTPSRAIQRAGSIDQYGGKLINWGSSLATTPSLTYPSSSPTGATIGFTNTSIVNGIGIGSGGFSVENTSNIFGFYLHKLGIRYFEYTILDSGNAQIGLKAPSGALYTGLGITRVQLSSTGVVETSSGDLPVTYTMETNQVIGFILNFITATIEIYVDNVLLTTIVNIETSVLWTQLLDCSSAEVKMNIGQDAFIYTKAGTVAWADDYV